MGKNGKPPDVDDENVLDRVSRLEDDFVLLEKRLDALLSDINRAQKELKAINQYRERRQT